MDTSTLLTTVLKFDANISATDADNTQRRARYLQYAQEVFEYVWLYSEWDFSYASTSQTVSAASSSGSLPADFLELGQKGMLFNTTTNRKMKEIPPQDIMEMRARGIVDLNVFAISGYNTTTSRKQIQLTHTQGFTGTVFYRMTAPTLVDTTGTSSNLQYIPYQYHQTVLLPGVRMKARKSVGDMRDFEQAFEKNIQFMLARERPRKTAVQRLPSTQRGMW